MGIKEVTAGAEWLDENFPGWEREIDLQILDIADGCRCVLAQVRTDTFMNVLQSVYRGIDWAIGHGFTLSLPSAARWAELDELWISLIKERFSSGNLSDEREG